MLTDCVKSMIRHDRLDHVILKVGVLFSRLALSTYEATLEGGPDDMTVVDATTLRRQVSSSITRSSSCGIRLYHGTSVTEKKTFCDLSIAHQVKSETPTFGGGEQGARKAGDDHVLSHCSFLAHQHLGVVATLEPAFIFAITMTGERTVPHSVCQMLATALRPCVRWTLSHVYKACYTQG